METAVVTGVAGFIGSHLAERLLEEKFKVIGIDCFTNYYARKIKQNNLKHCLKNKNFIFLEQDLDKADLHSIFKNVHYIFHEAAQPGVRSSWGKEFDTYVQNNIIITQKILEVAKECKSLKKIIMASSSSVYGNREGKMHENLIPKPESPYGATKLSSEHLGMIYAHNYDLPVTSLRYFTVYGPRQRPDMAFTRFIIGALTGKKITVYGTGEQTRDFTYINDIVDANLASLENQVSGEIINVGGGHIVSINEVLKILEDISNSELRISYEQKQKGDVEHTEADISKANKLLSFNPKMRVMVGLRTQFEYIKEDLNLYNGKT